MVARVLNNRIDRVFADLALREEKALITYLMAGDPDLAGTGRLVKALAEAGADLIELGVPFSDPLADGPSIQRAGQRSLAQGTTLLKIFDLVRKLRESMQTPLVLMTYYNPVLRFGLQEFATLATEAGIDGVIVPDLPLEESREFAHLLKSRGAYLVSLLAPTSTEDKIAQVTKAKGGFIYAVSLTGVTGARQEMPAGVTEFLQRIKGKAAVPVAVGFGISTPEQAAKIAKSCDGVIVGSAIVDLVEKYKQDISRLEVEIKRFVGTLKAGL